MTARQCFSTSRVQAFCSSGVPRPLSALATVEKASEVKARARRYLRILFLHSEADVPCPARALAGKVLRGIDWRREPPRDAICGSTGEGPNAAKFAAAHIAFTAFRKFCHWHK